MKSFLKNKWPFVLIIVLFLLLSSSDYTMYLSILASINAIAVLGVVIITGYARQLHLGQAAFMGLGAYVSAILTIKLNWSWWFTIPAAVGVSIIFGVLLGIPSMKLRGGPYLALVTQVFGEIIYLIILNWIAVTGGPFGINGIKRPELFGFAFKGLQPFFFLCIAFLLISYLICRQITISRYGRFFISIKESEAAAQSLGINTMKYKIIAFAIAAAFGGLAGTLYGPFIGFISPDQFRWQASLIIISMAIVGGLSKLEGGLIGSFALVFLPEFLRLTDQMRLIIYGALIIIVLAFLPNGIISLWGKSPKQIQLMFKERFNELVGSEKYIKKREGLPDKDLVK